MWYIHSYECEYGYDVVNWFECECDMNMHALNTAYTVMNLKLNLNTNMHGSEYEQGYVN
jgi:hypothetical protein